MHIGNAGGLLQGYDRAETTVNNAIGGLTGPLTEAYGLLAYTPHPNAHPRVQLTDIASGLGKDQVDLAWRRDWISSHDGVDVPATLGDAIAQLGLTGSDALKAEIATLNGGDLSDVVAKALQARKAEADAERLTELNELIDDWNGSDNDPLLDDLLRERRNIIRAYVSGDAPVPEAIAAAFFKTSADEGGPVLLDDLKDLWDQIPNKDLIAVAALLMLSGNREPEEQVEERSLWGSFRHNFVDGNSVIGSLARGRLSPQAAATIAQNAPDVIDTLDNAFSEISSLNPASIEGITLLLENPEQFVDNYINFAGGVGEWAVDTGTMAGALIIAGNPGLNAAYAQQTGTNVQQEVINALKSTATLAIEDPDAFAALAVDWEGLEDDPIHWFGTQTPDIVIEVLTAGAAGGAIATRRGANVAGDLTGAIDDLPPAPRVGDEARTIARRRGTSQDSSVHLIDGEINRRGKAVGGHYRHSPNIRIIEEWVDPVTGMDTARIEIFDPETETFIPKNADTTLFPRDWTPDRIIAEVQSAFGNSVGKRGNQWEGVSASGIRIRGYYRNSSSPGPGWSSAYPIGAS